MGILPLNNGFQFPVGYLPSDIQTAYGIDNIKFGSIVGDGTGQTIAIVDAYDDPAFVDSTSPGFANSDLAQFDLQTGIPDPPSFTKVNQLGQTSPLPGTDPAAPATLMATGKSRRPLISNGRIPLPQGPTSFSSKRIRIRTITTCSPQWRRLRLSPVSRRSP
jgi:hypothetical protein